MHGHTAGVTDREGQVSAKAPGWVLIAHVGVTVANDVQKVEGGGEQPGAQQVAQGRQVGNGEVVGVVASPPQPVHQPVGDVEQDEDLSGTRKTVEFRKGFECMA